LHAARRNASSTSGCSTIPPPRLSRSRGERS
jgi:hypothetical protein